MAIDIKWEYPPGNELQDLQFDPGQPVHLSVHVTDMIGGPAQVSVNVDIRSYSGEQFNPIVLSGGTNWFTGNVDWDLNMPNAIALAKVTVNVENGLSVYTQNIGIGTIPDPQPQPFNWAKLLPVAIVVAAVLVGTSYLKKKLPIK